MDEIPTWGNVKIGVITIRKIVTVEEFKRRVEHAKRYKLWKSGHTDSEIAIACGTNSEKIKAWRRENKFKANLSSYGSGLARIRTTSKRMRSV